MSIHLATEDTKVPDITPVHPAAPRGLPMRRSRRAAARLALTALLTVLPVGATALGTSVAHAVPVAAASVEPIQVGGVDVLTVPDASAFDRGDDEERDRDDHRHHDCRRHGGLVPLVVNLLFGFDRHC
jgi:hypothetical protein